MYVYICIYLHIYRVFQKNSYHFLIDIILQSWPILIHMISNFNSMFKNNSIFHVKCMFFLFIYRNAIHWGKKTFDHKTEFRVVSTHAVKIWDHLNENSSFFSAEPSTSQNIKFFFKQPVFWREKMVRKRIFFFHRRNIVPAPFAVLYGEILQ